MVSNYSCIPLNSSAHASKYPGSVITPVVTPDFVFSPTCLYARSPTTRAIRYDGITTYESNDVSVNVELYSL